jgi:hypothetical protein
MGGVNMKTYNCKVLTDNVHPDTGVDSIPYPQDVSEFEVQAHLFFELRAMGMDVRGEVSSTLRSSRLDLVVFKDKTAVLIIEVKKKLRGVRNRHSQRKRIHRQTKQYRNLLVPLVIIVGMDDANEFLKTGAASYL